MERSKTMNPKDRVRKAISCVQMAIDSFPHDDDAEEDS